MNRQIRLSSPEQIQKRLAEFAGKKMNVVLRNRKVMFGILREADGRHLRFADMRGETFSFPLNEVSEVYLDANQ